ncbi:hypothetical protein, partial [Ensifer sp. SSB1]|uniref:hypothetical protein n=1 Tax=Ensifer sp. SSB1 TaxID=2795385 RepID=UPI001A503825
RAISSSILSPSRASIAEAERKAEAERQAEAARRTQQGPASVRGAGQEQQPVLPPSGADDAQGGSTGHAPSQKLDFDVLPDVRVQ